MINTEVMLQSNSASYKGKVVWRSITLEGFIDRSCNENPKLNSLVHDSKFSNGKVKDHAANVIDESMFPRTDS